MSSHIDASHSALSVDAVEDVSTALAHESPRALPPRLPTLELAPSRRVACSAAAHDNELLLLEDVLIDGPAREVSRAGKRISLTHLEFELLRFLARHRGRVLTRDDLVEHVWRGRVLVSPRTVDIHVHRVRAKLGAPFDRLIETVRPVGYKLNWSTDRSVATAWVVAAQRVPAE